MASQLIKASKAGEKPPILDHGYKYTAKFQAKANTVDTKSMDKKEISATLDHLKSLLPQDQTFIDENNDLIFTAFDLFTANLANKNGDCVLKDDSIKIAKGFVDRYANLEHNRWNIVGHANDYAFSTFGEDEPKIYSDKEVESLGEFDLFNISLAAIIYKMADPYFAEFVQEESSNPNSHYYNAISASFEVGFNDIWIAVGSPNMADATIVKEAEEVAKLEPYLIASGGTGYTKEGQPVYRIAREVKPLGFGYVESPAGSVQGLVSAGFVQRELLEVESDKIEEKVDELKISIDEKFEGLSKKIEASQNIKDNNIKTSVNQKQNTKNRIMIKSIDDIQQDQMEQIQASDVRVFLKDEVSKANEAWEAKLNAEAQAKKDIEEDKAKLEETLDEQKTSLANQTKEIETLKNEIQTLKDAEIQAQADKDFQDRMELLSEEYDLEKDQKAVVAKAVKQLGSTEDFNNWKENFDIIAKLNSRDKSNEEKAKESLASAKGEDSNVPSSFDLNSETYMNSLEDSFKLKTAKASSSVTKTLF